MKALPPIRRAGRLLVVAALAAAPVAVAADPPPPAAVPKPVAPPAAAGNGVVVTLDPKALPHTPGWTVIAPTVRVDGKPMPFEFGLWLPKAYKVDGPPLPVIVHMHNRFAIGGGGDGRLEEEGLPALLCRGSLTDNRATGSGRRSRSTRTTTWP